MSIEGTDAGRSLATVLALISAVFHAAFGALQKHRVDPWIMRGAIDGVIALIALPVAFLLVPWPEGKMWVILGGAVIIHFFYKLFMAMAYSRAAYTAVYPVVRGTGPLLTVAFAVIVFGEAYSSIQWLGVAALSAAILGLAGFNIAEASIDGRRLATALALAAITGAWVALYTVYDAWGLRQAHDPFTFLAWFFLLSSLDFPVISWILWRSSRDRPRPVFLLRQGFVGALLAYVSFGGVMLATRLDKVGEAAVLRETSVVFAAFFGWLLLGERIGVWRFGLMVAIGLGALTVEFGS